MKDNIKLEILNYSYWEHHRRAKELAFTLPLKHPKRIELEEELNKLLDEIKLTKENK